jgi:hypothetical protein
VSLTNNERSCFLIQRSFFTSYHPYLPFLDQRSPVDCYNQSTLLFWTIVGVASRRYEQDITLLRVLSSLVTKMAWDGIASAHGQLATIQALLLLCSWPFPATSVVLEPTPTWSDIAMSMAIQRGLHQPQRASEFNRTRLTPSPSLQQEMSKTWVACKIVAQKYDWVRRSWLLQSLTENSTAAIYGVLNLASLQLYPSLQNNSTYTETFPPTLSQQLSIATFCARIDKSLFEHDLPSRPTSIEAVINGLRNELKDVKATTGDISGKYTWFLDFLHLPLMPHVQESWSCTGCRQSCTWRSNSSSTLFLAKAEGAAF